MSIYDELEAMATGFEYSATRFAFQVSNRLGVLLDQKGWKRKDLAASMGVSRQYLSQLFSAKQNVTLRQLAKVCFALQVEPIALFSTPPPEELPDTPSSYECLVYSASYNPFEERLAASMEWTEPELVGALP